MTTLLVDLGSLYWKAWYQTREPSEAYNLAMGSILTLLDDYDRVIVCCDGGSLKRAELYPEYKAHRDPRPPEAHEALRSLKRAILDAEMELVECRGYEADDVIATLAKYATEQTHILTADKDLYQLLDGEKVWIVDESGALGGPIGPQQCIEKFGVRPYQLRDYLTLVGDASDNVPGCPGIGPGRAAQLLSKFGSLEVARLASTEELRSLGKSWGPKTVEQFRNWDHRLARELVTLMTDAPVFGEAPAQVQQTHKETETMGRMSLDAITTGGEDTPYKLVVYGDEGVGKTTFGAGAPSPVFLVEPDGLRHPSLRKLPKFPTPLTWNDVEEALQTLLAGGHTYRTVVVDTLDYIEPLSRDFICKKHSKPSLEDFGYGAGYVKQEELWLEFLGRLDRLHAAGMNVVLNCHAITRTYRNPTGDDWDTHEIKLPKKLSALVREWPSAVLFAQFKAYVKKDRDTDKKGKAFGDGSRVMYTDKRPAFFAKNRYGLPFEMPFSWAEFERHAREAKPAEPDQLVATITELAETAPDELKAEALGALSRAGDDATKLAQLLDWLRGSLSAAA